MNEMAFSSIHDVDHHHHGHLHCHPPEHLHCVPAEQYVPSECFSNEEKHFIPNPDAKPFIPNLHTFSANWHFYRNETGKNLNLPFIVNPQIDSDVMFANFSPNSSRKHIAFHLVSNVLDDEVMEEIQVSDVSNTLFNKLHPPQPLGQPTEQNLYSNASWQTGSSSNFSLPLGVGKSSSDKSSINNKSIHEIWSPDPSPNELTQLSQTEDVMNTISQQSLESSFTETQRSFEQIEIESSHVDYSGMPKDDSQYFTQSPEYPIPSPVFPQYQYCNSNEVQQPIQKNISHPEHPVYLGQPQFYPNSQYYGHDYGQPKMICELCGYHSCNHFNSRNRPKNKQMHTMYDLKVTFLEKLGISLDACFDQLRHLDRDSKKADSSLLQTCCLRKSSSSDLNTVKYPSNSTRVDKLVMDQEKEHQKVESLIGRIERQGLTPLHPNVGLTLDQWHTVIKELRNTRKSELASLSDVSAEYCGGKSHTESDMTKLIDAVYKLTKQTRAARTAVWCAMQMFYANDKTEPNE